MWNDDAAAQTPRAMGTEPPAGTTTFSGTVSKGRSSIKWDATRRHRAPRTVVSRNLSASPTLAMNVVHCRVIGTRPSRQLARPRRFLQGVKHDYIPFTEGFAFHLVSLSNRFRNPKPNARKSQHLRVGARRSCLDHDLPRAYNAYNPKQSTDRGPENGVEIRVS